MLDRSWRPASLLPAYAPGARARGLAAPGLVRFMGRELLLWVGLYVLYLVVRGQTIRGHAEALQHARSVVSFERVTRLAHELEIQRLLSFELPLRRFFSAYYELGFFPVVIGLLLAIALRDRALYLRIRTAMLIALALASVIFSVYPTAPPRMVDGLGVVDTVGMQAHDSGSVYGVRTNPYAAMPSMHVGWTLLVSLGALGAARRRLSRLAFLAHPPLMAGAVVATGNHYLLDVIVGTIVALAALVAVDHRPRRLRLSLTRPLPVQEC